MNNSKGQLPQLPSFDAYGTGWRSAASGRLRSTPQSLTKQARLLLVSGLYVAVLLWAYAAVVSPAFAYDGMTLTWRSPLVMLWLITLAVLPSIILPYSMSRPSGLILWWLYFSTYVPSILVPALSLSLPYDTLLPLHLSLLLCMGLLCWAGTSRPLHAGEYTLSTGVFWAVFCLVWVLCMGLVCMHGRAGLVLQNLASLFRGANEYTIRSEYSLLVQEEGRALAYIVGAMANALNPFLIAFGLVYRRKTCLIAGILGQIVVFGLTGFKTALFSVLFLSLVALFDKRWRRCFGVAIAMTLIAAVLTAAAVDRATGKVFGSSWITRRTLVVPGLVTGFYYEHYSRVGPIGLAMHFSREAVALTPANEIGFIYFGNANTNANANLWAEAFAELGLPGMVFFTIFTALAIWLYDSLAAKRQLGMAAMLAAMPAVMLSNTSATTTMVSHGGLLAAILLYLAPAPQTAESREPKGDPEESEALHALQAEPS